MIAIQTKSRHLPFAFALFILTAVSVLPSGEDPFSRFKYKSREEMFEAWKGSVQSRDRDWLISAAADPKQSLKNRIGSALILLQRYQDHETRVSAMQASLLRVEPFDNEWSSGLDWRLLLPVAAKAIQFPELMPVLVEMAVHQPYHDFQITWPLMEYGDAGVDPVPELERWYAQLTDPALKEWCDRLLERVDPVRSKKFWFFPTICG
jgi:hypothetical protein